MRLSLKNTSEVCHYFANQVQNEGYSGNVKFIGNAFYSYRTIVARIINGSVVYSTRSYSMTTAGHVSDLRSASRHRKQVGVYDVGAGVKGNKEAMQGEIKSYLNKACTARTQKEYYINQAIKTAENFNAYFDVMNEDVGAETMALRVSYDSDYCKIDMEQFKHIDFAALKAAEKARQDLELAKRKEREAANALENSAKIEQWLNGERDNLGYGVSSDTLLRVKSDMIQTSGGAEIPLTDAPNIWSLVNIVKARGRDIEVNHKTGVYRMTNVSCEGNITVGCHFIKFEQLHRIAKILGYI